ncbi:hypothetical protein C9374_004660 [Naegleria lovaniensis]|uniref:Uncharacterized protein n=1 Tax=Naegleria lovaniensis TaxID=51637 RepID=A0AA88GSG3_NAELO|nr:uncharacterized protein C9374_004660 [Naegleria lovaniensis]KAG2383323.1 hypothetical protein C9374_004660 [Naegleria lovaniensis]
MTSSSYPSTTSTTTFSSFWHLVHGCTFVLALLESLFHIAAVVMMGILQDSIQFGAYEYFISMIVTSILLLAQAALCFQTMFGLLMKFYQILHVAPNVKFSDSTKFGLLSSYVSVSGISLGLCLYQTFLFGMFERITPVDVYIYQCGLAASVVGCVSSLLCVIDSSVRLKLFFKETFESRGGNELVSLMTEPNH